MSLIERAIELIQTADLSELSQLLIECIEARNAEGLAATQRLYEEMYDDTTFNLLMKSPAAHGLICWGEAGLDALIESAKRTPTTKNISLTLKILSGLAAGEIPIYLTVGIRDQKLVDLIEGCINDVPVLHDAARLRLNEFIISFPDDDTAAMAVGFSLQTASFQSVEPAKQLFTALAARWLVISRPTLDHYKELIRTNPTDEAKFQTFFEQFPQLLDPMAYQVWPKPDLHGAKEPDFVIRRTDNSYLVIEIETPGKQIVTESNQFSALVTQAVTQAMQYRSFLLERFPEARMHFPCFQDPDCLVVIGLEEKLSDEQKRALLLENQHRKGVRIVGFDWLASRAAAITQNIIRSNITVHPLRMI